MNRLKAWWSDTAWPNLKAAGAAVFSVWFIGVRENPPSHLITLVIGGLAALALRWFLA